MTGARIDVVGRAVSTFHRGHFWFSEGHAGRRDQVKPILQSYGVMAVGSPRDAYAAITASPSKWAGLVIDAGAVDWIGALRRKVPGLPILALVTGLHERPINEMQTLGVEVGIIPFADARVHSFAQRALVSTFLPDDRVALVVRDLVERHQLTEREVQLLAYGLGDEPRARVRRRLGISENTLKAQIKGLLQKCGGGSVDGLAKNVLRTALHMPVGTGAEL